MSTRRRRSKGRTEPSAVGARPNENGDRCFHRPPLSGSGRGFATPVGSQLVPVKANPGGFQSGSSSKRTSMNSLSRFLRPKAPVPPDSGESGFGIGFPLCLALLLQSPYLRIHGFDPEGSPPLPRWQRSEALFRFRSAAPDCVIETCLPRPDSARRRGLWITRITWITCVKRRRPRGRRRGCRTSR